MCVVQCVGSPVKSTQKHKIFDYLKYVSSENLRYRKKIIYLYNYTCVFTTTIRFPVETIASNLWIKILAKQLAQSLLTVRSRLAIIKPFQVKTLGQEIGKRTVLGCSKRSFFSRMPISMTDTITCVFTTLQLYFKLKRLHRTCG